MGKFNALLDALGIVGKEAKAVGDDAAKAIEKVTSDEIGVNLTGEARKQYLNALDQVYGSQSVRKQLTGHTQKVFHGTPYKKEIKAFRESGTKKGDIAKYGKGVYVTPSENYASQYADFGEGQVIPLLAKKTKDFHPADLEQAKQILTELNVSIPEKTGLLRYGEEGLHLLEKTLGKNWSDRIAEKGYRVNLPDDLIMVKGASDLRSPNAAFDPRFKDSPLLMAGGLAGANILPTTEQQLNPFARLSDVAGAWETAKEKVTKPLAKSLNLSGNPQDEVAFNQILKTGLDPLNFLPGAAGLAAGAAQMFTPSDEERAKKEAEDEMRKRVLNQMAGQ